MEGGCVQPVCQDLQDQQEQGSNTNLPRSDNDAMGQRKVQQRTLAADGLAGRARVHSDIQRDTSNQTVS